MARRSLKFTVDREPIDLELGGDHYTAPAILAPATLGELLDSQRDVQDALATLAKSGDGELTGERGAMKKALDVIAGIFDLILADDEQSQQFRSRLFSHDRPFDLRREVMPAIIALVEEYAGRPTQPSLPSANGPAATGTPSTAGAPAGESTPSPSQPTASAT